MDEVTKVASDSVRHRCAANQYPEFHIRIQCVRGEVGARDQRQVSICNSGLDMDEPSFTRSGAWTLRKRPVINSNALPKAMKGNKWIVGLVAFRSFEFQD